MHATPNGPGLSLSGGGYRAAAFHLGTLKKLEELKVLSKIDVCSTISGGSITGAAWCLYDGDYNSFHKLMEQKLQTKGVVRFVLLSTSTLLIAVMVVLLLIGPVILSFTKFAYLVFPLLFVFFFLLIKFQFRIWPVSKIIEKAYDKFFYEGKTLSQLKDRPLLAIGSSNLQTGRPFTFSKKKMSDSFYSSKDNFDPPITFKQAGFPVARAVMASSSVPFAFTPVTIDTGFFTTPADALKVYPQLVDGGVYDNQGIQKITEQKSMYECNIIITSDAGGNFLSDARYANTFTLLLRTVNLFMNRIKNAQMAQQVFKDAAAMDRPIAYLSLGWGIEKCIPGFVKNMMDGLVPVSVINFHNFEQQWIDAPAKFKAEIHTHLERKTNYALIESRNLNADELALARGTSTNLARLEPKRIDCLIRHAENLTELQVKLYCLSLL
jgi:NTE family protein